MEAKNRILKRFGIGPITAFIPSLTGRRGPLFEGLPTLEVHREMEPEIAAKHLFALGIDAVFFGDGMPSLEEIESVGKVDEKVLAKELTSKDVVCGIAASGRTPYVIGGMKYAREIGAKVLCVTMNPESDMAKMADIPIAVVVGPEAIMGSTRLKAGTAQKLVLNMLTTGAMVKLGRVYSNLMVDVKASNEKLVARAKKIVMLATGVDEATATTVLSETKYDVKLGILMLKTGLDQRKAKEILASSQGYIQKAIDQIAGERVK